VPERYGTTRSPVPAGFLGQLVYPLHGYGVRAFMWHRPLASSVCAAAILIMGGVGYRALESWDWRKYYQPSPDSMVETLPDPAAYPSVAGSYRVGEKFEAAVTAVAVTGDGRRFARASEDGTIKVWDAGATTSRTLTGHGRATTCAAISSDGQKVISASRDRTVKIWDADTGAELQSLSGNASPVLSISIAHDGNRFVSGSADGEIRIWDRDGQEQRTLSRQTGAVPSVAISADGRRVAAAMMSTARIWDVETGKVVTLAGHDDMVYCVAISPDGQHVVTGSFDQTLKVWDAATGKEERTLRGHKRNVYSVAISQDGQWIVSGGYDTTARVWQASTGREMFTLVGGHEAMVVSVAITADGGQILSGDMNGVVKLWNPRAEIQTIPR
jgi:WD40 repeat protein